MPALVLALALALVLAGCGGDGERRVQTTTEARPAQQDVFAYDRTRPLALKLGRVLNPGKSVRVREASYASPHARGGRVPAFLVLPRGKGPFPAAIYMHGADSDRSGLLPLAVALADRGFVALAVSGPAVRQSAPVTVPGIEGARQLRDLYVQNVVDLRRAVDVLRSLPQVQQKPIGYVGFSYGAIIGGILSGVENRIRAYVFMSGGASTQDLSSSVPAEFRPEFRQITATVDPARYVGDAAPASLLFQDGRRDELVSPDQLRGLYAVASEPKELRWYDAGHVLNAKAVDEQLAWLERTLR